MRIERIDSPALELAAVRSAPAVSQPAAPSASAAVLLAPQPAPHQPAPAPERDGAEREPEQRFLDAARALRAALGPMANTAPRFQADPGSNQVLVEIVDEASGEVVRRIPEETILKFAESWDAYLGTLVDKEA